MLTYKLKNINNYIFIAFIEKIKNQNNNYLFY